MSWLPGREPWESSVTADKLDVPDLSLRCCVTSGNFLLLLGALGAWSLQSKGCGSDPRAVGVLLALTHTDDFLPLPFV